MYILLCGFPPFQGTKHKEIFEKIKNGKYSFEYPEWRNVSGQAKHLIKVMLQY